MRKVDSTMDSRLNLSSKDNTLRRCQKRNRNKIMTRNEKLPQAFVMILIVVLFVVAVIVVVAKKNFLSYS